MFENVLELDGFKKNWHGDGFSGHSDTNVVFLKKSGDTPPSTVPFENGNRKYIFLINGPTKEINWHVRLPDCYNLKISQRDIQFRIRSAIVGRPSMAFFSASGIGFSDSSADSFVRKVEFGSLRNDRFSWIMVVIFTRPLLVINGVERGPYKSAQKNWVTVVFFRQEVDFPYFLGFVLIR